MVRCKLTNCTIAEDSRCLEGRGVGCPNLLTDDSITAAGTPVPEVDGSDRSAFQYPPTELLYSGLPLEIAEAREFSLRARAIVVALAGMRESGKTSLLARLHQLFQAGPVGGYDFAGSRTLLRFEELNWLATVESGVCTPTMARSSRQYDNTFLHLTVRQRFEDAEPVDLLLNDISGETFPEVIAAESVSEQLVCLRRADHVVLVVDGAAIANRNLRHDHCAKAKNFVQRVLQTGQIGKQTVLHLIITKLDALLKQGDASENDEAAERLETEFDSEFRTRVAKIYSWRIAARPLDGSMPTETIIAKLFATWAESTHRYTKHLPVDPASAEFARDFCRFGL
jgi:hypothetical protein